VYASRGRRLVRLGFPAYDPSPDGLLALEEISRGVARAADATRRSRLAMCGDLPGRRPGLLAPVARASSRLHPSLRVVGLKYAYFDVVAYNEVGDSVKHTIRGYSEFTGKPQARCD
jgi:hypothetical protein